MFKQKYKFEKCEHPTTESKTYGCIAGYLKHLKDFHSKDFEHICDINNVWGVHRVQLKASLDDMKDRRTD